MNKLLTTIAVIVFSQIHGLNAQSFDSGTSTYAVVVGISDYQDKDIPDLRFADRDAEAFANYLRSPAGGSLDGDHLKLLTNEKATMAQFAKSLDWLWEVCKEGDQVVIYFSGHGDVEKKSLTQPGFLLCWDAPERVYMSGGAFALPMLQEVISTLSTQNKAKVVVITDACHSAKLAGSEIYGAQLTGQNLARQYANEIKLLSCQPDEYSIEGEQWGGGRGAFSYYLVDALYGMADANNDLSVNLKEVGRYLEDHVTAEVAPVSQNPKVVGNPSEPLASVNANLLAELRSGKTSQRQLLYPIENRGMEDDVLAGLDTTTLELYRFFQKALMDKAFFIPNAGEPATACADAYYERLMAEPKLARLHTTMTRNYAAALQDDAQQTLNEWLKTSQEVSLDATADARLPQKVFTEKVMTYPRCLDRAAELLGSNHYMYAALKARQYFFEGYLLAKSNKNPSTELGGRALAMFRQSLEWQPEQPQVFWQMSQVFAFNLDQLDSLEHYTRRALEIYPNWLLPYTDAASLLCYRYRQFDRARPFLEQANLIDSNASEVLNSWAIYYYNQKNFKEAELQFKKVAAVDSMNIFVWSNLGLCYIRTNGYTEAEMVAKKAIALDSTIAFTWNVLGLLYLETFRYAEAEPVFKKAIALDSTYSNTCINLGILYFQTSRYAEAELHLKKAIALNSTVATAWSDLGYLYYYTSRYAEAELHFKKAIALDSTLAVAWKNLGTLYIDTRRYAEAEPALKKAIAGDSTNLLAWHNLGYLYNQTRRYAEAEPIYKKAIALDSANTFAWHNLGYNYLQTRRYAEAEPVFKKAIALDSTLANPRRNLGMVYFKTNRPEEAWQSFLKALELNPDYAGAMLGIAYLLLSEGKTTEAISYVEQAIGKGSTFEQLEKDEDLASLREQKEQWEALMKKYFADKIYYNLAREQSLKGELDKAFESLELSLTSGWKDYDWMQKDIDFAPLREQKERWGVLMKQYFPLAPLGEKGRD